MSRYIDADRLMKYIDSAESIGFGIIETKLVRDLVNDTPTAEVVERKDIILDKTEARYQFEYIDDHKNIVFKLPYALNDITDIRIRLDKYGLRENVKGEWIDEKRWSYEYDGNEIAVVTWKCSECGEETNIRSNFCPECGAEMGVKE